MSESFTARKKKQNYILILEQGWEHWQLCMIYLKPSPLCSDCSRGCCARLQRVGPFVCTSEKGGGARRNHLMLPDSPITP